MAGGWPWRHWIPRRDACSTPPGGGGRITESASSAAKTSVNHEYAVWFVRRFQERDGNGPDFRVLDYGCGAGEIVEMGLARGLPIAGVDVFYGGSNDLSTVCEKGLLGREILPSVAGRIPHPDASFDFVISNQVFEHVADLDPALAEIERVLKPDGHMLALFPHRGVLWEAHMSVPFTHWFRKGSKVRFLWAFGWRCLGFGCNKVGKSRWAWTRHTLSWMDTYCFYRSRREMGAALRPLFEVRELEGEYIQFRKSRSWRWRILAPFPAPLNFVNGAIFRALSGSVILARKKSVRERPAREDGRPRAAATQVDIAPRKSGFKSHSC